MKLPGTSIRRRITIPVFYRGFTAFSSQAEPDEVMGLLAEYHQALGKVIVSYEATLTCFMGDGLMLLINAPVPCRGPAMRAARMAIDMQGAVQPLIVRWRARGHRLGFGVGIATGQATVAEQARESLASELQNLEKTAGAAADLKKQAANAEKALSDASAARASAQNELVDLTKHRQEEERLRFLLDELNHRTQNTLATVQSIAVQTLRGAAPEAVVDNFLGRILALSKAHKLLGREDWESVLKLHIAYHRIYLQFDQRFRDYDFETYTDALRKFIDDELAALAKRPATYNPAPPPQQPYQG